jgi:hypothetical protein
LITEQWGRIRYRFGKRSSAQFDNVNRAAPKRWALFGKARRGRRCGLRK